MNRVTLELYIYWLISLVAAFVMGCLAGAGCCR